MPAVKFKTVTIALCTWTNMTIHVNGTEGVVPKVFTPRKNILMVKVQRIMVVIF